MPEVKTEAKRETNTRFLGCQREGTTADFQVTSHLMAYSLTIHKIGFHGLY
jgi:hypothetical protein